ncbi:Fur family zinc uptake regulator [Frigoribacterium sp. PhB107]|uniref:Fur family transcriptional regulator n=1 Tax=Frigoribacterium sp. PhB107 TaxID=2485172 RepID=UPI000F4948CB|nr:transcriptional repressor [Frigoribacterium sp. PhB107]ROP73519.1 Fur family zinc uptake regulator [Frigoribacterium sp. PhB107]
MVAKRNTWQREAVREALGRSEGFVSAQSLHGQLRETGSPIGLATVYRALADLATDGAADSLQQEGESLYRACTPGTHHHHLICRTCGTTVEIEADAVETWARQIAAQHGFTEAQHIVDVFGTCAACTAEKAAGRDPAVTRGGAAG